jgi:phosphoglycerate dehydrogenase-like enzyme
MKILVASSIDPYALETLGKQHDVICAFNAPGKRLKSLIVDREVLVFRSGVKITAEVMQCAPNLRLLVRAGSGLDNLDVGYVQQRGLKLVRLSQPGARAVAELTFGLMLALARQILSADQLLRQGRWAKHELTGRLLHGKVLGIVGPGNIGSLVGQMGAAWGMTIFGFDADSSPQNAERLRSQRIQLRPFRQVLESADFLTIHVPLDETTRNLIGAEQLAWLKPSAFLLNLARGGVVDEHALYRALTEEGRPAGAALDVHEQEGEENISPLAELPNVVLTPHIGAMTVDSQKQIGQGIVQAIAEACLESSVGTATAKRTCRCPSLRAG